MLAKLIAVAIREVREELAALDAARAPGQVPEAVFLAPGPAPAGS